MLDKMENNTNLLNNQHKIIQKEYGKIALKGSSCCGATSCCGSHPESVAQVIGYNTNDLANLPDGANMGLSCGNPTAIAALNSGETVLDLGSGGGFDVFIAARKVGAEGFVIGVDMTPEMIAKAKSNAETFKQSTGLNNVEFRLGEIEHLPVADNSIDVIISNCVINLSPNKSQVWREIARVLKPGGRASISDLALLQELPPEIMDSVQALVGCISGAVLVEDTYKMIQQSGLKIISSQQKSDYIQSMSNWEDPLYRELAQKIPNGLKPQDYVTSLDVLIEKPLLND